MNPTRILVIDDSPLIRQILVDMLRKEPDLEVVGFARDGEEALLRIAELSPDVVTLDVDMPRLDGLECLKELMATRPVPAVMIATLSPTGIENAFEALAIGAVDFVGKPDSGSISTLRGIREELVAKVRHARLAQVPKAFAAPIQKAQAVETDRVVLISGAAGGPRALIETFKGLPQGFAAPVLISPQLPSPFIDPLARRLTDLGAMPVREARPGDRLQPGLALVVPREVGVKVDDAGCLVFETGLPFRPSTDRTWESAASALGPRCVAAILSGSGVDGADGAMAIRRAGGTVLAEDEETCTVYGIAEAAVALGAVDRSVPIHAMGEAIAETASQACVERSRIAA